MWFAGATGLFILVWYVWQTRHAIPLIDAVRGANPAESARLRHDALAGLRPASLAALFQYDRDFLLPIASILSVLGWLERKRTSTALTALFVCSLATLAGILTLEKSPLVNLAIALVAGLLLFPQRPSRWLISVWVALVALGVLMLTKLTNAPDRTLGNLLEGLYRRIVLGPAEVAAHYFSWAPTQSGGFLHGAGLPVLHHFAARGPIDAPREVYKFMRPGETVVGSANGAFHAMAWADFGWVSVIVASLIVGGILVVVGVLSSRMSDGALRTTLLCLTIVIIGKTMSTSLTSSLLGIGLNFVDTVVILYAIDRLTARRSPSSRMTSTVRKWMCERNTHSTTPNSN